MEQEVLIFDCGNFWGKKIEGHIKEELPVKVRRVEIDWNQDVEKEAFLDVVDKICEKIETYIGTVEVIVIADPELALIALASLRAKYGEQKFVGYEGNLGELTYEANKVLIFAPVGLRRMEMYQKMKVQCSVGKVIEPRYEKWLSATRCNNRLTLPRDFTKEITIGMKVFILQRGLLAKRERLKELMGWRGELIDISEGITREVKEQCGLVKWVI